MKLLRLQVLFLALALVVANCQCFAACVTDASHDSVTRDTPAPPCHQHQPSKQSKAPAHCSHLSSVAELRAPAIASAAIVHLVEAFGLPVQLVSITSPQR